MSKLQKFSFFLLSVWWAWTVLVDFVVIKTVFATVDNFFIAGELGIALFSKLNGLELIVSTAFVSLTTFRKSWRELVIAIVLWSLTLIYFSYLTPKIISLTELWKQMDLIGIHSTTEIPDIQQEHQFYHRIYIALDSAKLLILSALLGLGIWKEGN